MKKDEVSVSKALRRAEENPKQEEGREKGDAEDGAERHGREKREGRPKGQKVREAAEEETRYSRARSRGPGRRYP